jgi:hypothetical protein
MPTRGSQAIAPGSNDIASSMRNVHGLAYSPTFNRITTKMQPESPFVLKLVALRKCAGLAAGTQ